MMKTALVLGITGGFGGHVARALLADGWHVKALVRDASKVADDLTQATIIEANATDTQRIIQHGQGCSVLVYGLNPSYDKWQQHSLPWLNASLTGAKKLQARLVFPANVYNFDPTKTALIDEDSPLAPVDHKGKIRVAQEAAIKKFVADGGQALLLRSGDFIAKDAPSAWFNMLIKPNKVIATADANIKHSWAYLPDVGKTIAKLLQTELDNHAVYHFSGHELSFADWHQALKQKNAKAKLSKFPWWSLKLVAPFMPTMKEVLAMRYLWQQPLALNNQKLRVQIGSEPHTPVEDLLTAELH